MTDGVTQSKLAAEQEMKAVMLNKPGEAVCQAPLGMERRSGKLHEDHGSRELKQS